MLEPAPPLDVVVRCRNEMPHVVRTLEALRRQRGVAARVHFIDCRSTDGSSEAAQRLGVPIIDQDPDLYVPGAVLNRAMRLTTSELVAFVNADAVPLRDDSLAQLIEPLLSNPDAAAIYGRQLPRRDAHRTTQLDHRYAFGDGKAPRVRHGRFFSMAASAVRRTPWRSLPFDEALGYSEDVDWTRRAGALGWSIGYAPEALFEHSHDYSLAASYRRRLGEGVADATIHRTDRPGLLSDLIRPALGALGRDLRSGQIEIGSLALRSAQAVGYYMGRRGGRR